MASDSQTRYAVYFFPDPSSTLALLGQAWLGRNVEEVSDAAQRPALDLPPELPLSMWRDATSAPRVYGFHATLKAPFHLAAGRNHSSLEAAISELAASLRPFEAPRLRVTDLAGFLALCLSTPSRDMDRLAERCVVDLDGFRAPLTLADQARRHPDRLSPRQRDHLKRWGYPYVLDDFLFHMTLTTRLSAKVKQTVQPALGQIMGPVCREPLLVDRISLFRQLEQGAPFAMVRQFSLGQSSQP